MFIVTYICHSIYEHKVLTDKLIVKTHKGLCCHLPRVVICITCSMKNQEKKMNKYKEICNYKKKKKNECHRTIT